MTILVDARHVGNIMKHARRSLHLKPDHVATILNVSRADYVNYERGKKLIPDDILLKMFVYSFISVHTRHALQFGPWRRHQNRQE